MNKGVQQNHPTLTWWGGRWFESNRAYHNVLISKALWKKRSNLDSVKEAYNSVDQRIAVIVSRRSRRGTQAGSHQAACTLCSLVISLLATQLQGPQRLRTLRTTTPQSQRLVDHQNTVCFLQIDVHYEMPFTVHVVAYVHVDVVIVHSWTLVKYRDLHTAPFTLTIAKKSLISSGVSVTHTRATSGM